MKYMGSKNRISKELLEIILPYRQEGQTWVEPFVGGGNMIDKVTNPRLGADAFKYTIDALILIRDRLDIIPKDRTEFTEDDYKAIKNSDNNPLKGFSGFAYSYGGKFFDGFRRDSVGKRDYVAESYRAAVKQSPNLQGVELVCCSYLDLVIPPNSLIYADPPYFQTRKHKTLIDHEEFWQWCRDRVKEGHTVFVSEYNAPDDFTCVWQKQVNSSLTKDTGGKKAVEKLFTYQLK